MAARLFCFKMQQSWFWVCVVFAAHMFIIPLSRFCVDKCVFACAGLANLLACYILMWDWDILLIIQRSINKERGFCSCKQTWRRLFTTDNLCVLYFKRHFYPPLPLLIFCCIWAIRRLPFVPLRWERESASFSCNSMQRGGDCCLNESNRSWNQKSWWHLWDEAVLHKR